MNWQAMFTVIAVICGFVTFGVSIAWVAALDSGDEKPTAWLIGLFFATLISAALAAGLSK